MALYAIADCSLCDNASSLPACCEFYATFCPHKVNPNARVPDHVPSPAGERSSLQGRSRKGGSPVGPLDQ